MIDKKLFPVIEALLFAYGEPLGAAEIADALELDAETAAENVSAFAREYNQKSGGLCIIELEDKFQMCTRTEYHDKIKKLLQPSKNPELSRAALEVLAIIAYTQPTIKAVVEQVRGVDCTGIMNKLLMRNLIEEKGRHNSPRKPILYGTTTEFLRAFGLSSLDDLPNAEKVEV